MMLSKAKIQLIRSLERRKGRMESGLFVAEGLKAVGDMLPLMGCRLLVATGEWLRLHGSLAQGADEVAEVSDDELRRISFMQAPQQVLALFEQPEWQVPAAADALYVALDDVQDPGNVGTIVRLCDWFGVRDLMCSLHTADAFSPKAVQASMGALARVRVHRVDLPAWLESVSGMAVCGTMLDGDNIYRADLPRHGVVLMGNEGRGLSDEVRRHATHRLLIPSYPPDEPTTDSLNVSTATAIVLSEFRRRQC